MTAAEALQLTLESKRTLKDVLFSIESMAKNGNRYAAFENNSVHDDTLIELKQLGYIVTVNTNNVLVEW